MAHPIDIYLRLPEWGYEVGLPEVSKQRFVVLQKQIMNIYERISATELDKRFIAIGDYFNESKKILGNKNAIEMSHQLVFWIRTKLLSNDFITVKHTLLLFDFIGNVTI